MSSLALLLLLLSLSVNACTGARLLGVVGTKDVKKVELHKGVLTAEKLQQIDQHQAAGGKAGVNGGTLVGETVVKKTNDSEALPNTVEVTEETNTISGVVRIQSLVAVSWRIPRGKQGDHHPGFNLDYSPPKTHPPSHN